MKKSLKINLAFAGLSLFFSVAANAQWPTSGNDIYNNNIGNVGVGTTTPKAPLNVCGPNAAPANGATANGAFFVGSTATGLALTSGVFSNGGSTVYSWMQSRNQTASIFYPLAFNPLGGNVGIGTTTPQRKFVVSNSGIEGIEISPSTGYSQIISYNRVSSSWLPLVLQDPAGGNVGIGTATPYAKLQVNGWALFTNGTTVPTSAPFIRGNSTNSSASNPDFTWYNNDQTGLFHPASNVIGFAIGGSERIRITGSSLDITGNISIGGLAGNGDNLVKVDNAGILSITPLSAAGLGLWQTINGTDIYNTTGNVGIGTNAPSEKLQIDNGNALIKGTDNFVASGNEAKLILGDANHYIKSVNGLGIKIGTYNAADGIFLQQGGNVGIGTDLTTNAADGNFKLAVNGGIRAKSIKVNTGWSDFVFEKNYKLKTLEEVENYIKQNGHLPEIPSAKEVEANGGDLGELVKLQMQKIEELTLYMIEMKKENEGMKKEIERIKSIK